MRYYNNEYQTYIKCVLFTGLWKQQHDRHQRRLAALYSLQRELPVQQRRPLPRVPLSPWQQAPPPPTPHLQAPPEGAEGGHFAFRGGGSFRPLLASPKHSQHAAVLRRQLSNPWCVDWFVHTALARQLADESFRVRLPNEGVEESVSNFAGQN